MSELIAPVILICAVIVFFYLRSNLSSDAAKENIRIGEEFLKLNKLNDGVVETKTGLQYKILSTGNGQIHPNSSGRIQVNFQGRLLDDTVFDSCINGEETTGLGLKQLIAGWREGLQLMVVGEKTRFFVPSKLAYGNQSHGKIKAGSLLIFDIELLSINDKT